MYESLAPEDHIYLVLKKACEEFHDDELLYSMLEYLHHKYKMLDKTFNLRLIKLSDPNRLVELYNAYARMIVSKEGYIGWHVLTSKHAAIYGHIRIFIDAAILNHKKFDPTRDINTSLVQCTHAIDVANING